MPNKIKLKEIMMNYSELKDKNALNEEEDCSLISLNENDYELE